MNQLNFRSMRSNAASVLFSYAFSVCNYAGFRFYALFMKQLNKKSVLQPMARLLLRSSR